MQFYWPSMLWFLMAVPLLVLAYVGMQRRRARAVKQRLQLALAGDSLPQRIGWRRHLPPMMFLAALVVTVVAVARPAAVITLPGQRALVVLAVDVSASMLETDVPPSRLIAAQRAITEFAAEQPRNVRIALVAFSSSAWVLQAPTLDREQVVSAVQRLQTYPATAMGSGILVSLATVFEGTEQALDVDFLEYGAYEDPWRGGLRGGSRGGPDRRGQSGLPQLLRTPDPVPPGSHSSAAIIVLSDGASNRGPDPIAMAQLAADMGVRVYTVGLGTETLEEGGFFGRASYLRLDEATLVEIAEMTDAAYYPAGTEGELREVYDRLGREVSLGAEPTELTAMFAGLAGLIALFGGVLSLLWFNRLA